MDDSKIHKQSQPHTYLTNLMLKKRLSLKNYNILISSNMLNSNAKNVCKSCIEEILISNSPRKPLEEDTINDPEFDDEDDVDKEYQSTLTIYLKKQYSLEMNLILS